MTGGHRNELSMTACGVRFDVLSLDHAIDDLLHAESVRAVHLCNAYSLGLASRDDEYASLLNRGDLNLPDGMPLVWMARRVGRAPHAERVYGPDVMAGCLDRGRPQGVRHYLFGSSEDVVARLVENIAGHWPEALIVGVESPPFRELSDAELDEAHERMVDSCADLVWVGLGTPKQDRVVAALASRGGPTFVAIGAAFDFLAGSKPMAPGWMQRIGLEWLFRLISEPRRLWRRYLVGIPIFVWGCVRQRPAAVQQGSKLSSDVVSRE